MSRKERRRMQREDQPNTRQLCSKNRMEEFHSRYPPPNTATPPPSSPFPSLCSRALTSFPTHVGPRHSQNSWVKYKLHQTHTLTVHIYTHTHKKTRLHKLQAWEHLGRLSLVSTWHKSSRGFPSLCSKTMFQCGCTGNVWVTWHWEYSSSFHCDKLGLHAQHHHTVQRNSNVERCGRT